MDPLTPKHPDYTFEPMGLSAKERENLPALESPALYSPALSMIRAPTQAIVDEELAHGTLQVWRMRARDGGEVAKVFFNEWTSLASIYVFVPPDGLFAPQVSGAATEALVAAIFAADSSCKDILTQVKRPEHSDAEERLARMGFETLGTRPEYEAHQRSYWLKRHIWDAYRSA